MFYLKLSLKCFDYGALLYLNKYKLIYLSKNIPQSLITKYLKNKLLLNLFASLLFLFVLFNSISKTYAVDCSPLSINASCDLNTTASKLIFRQIQRASNLILMQM